MDPPQGPAARADRVDIDRLLYGNEPDMTRAQADTLVKAKPFSDEEIPVVQLIEGKARSPFLRYNIS
ncbi:hypothetical protein IAQ61_003255 [Plenodomus lingam]|uniref:uncharacterized protein n=1 Tax=Leptosphaeria maculans TaxID=5022 RepID=UPI003332D5CB|nr:hypothetical protein IAQ61_003255 [Plenodomus lingam]